MPVIERESYEDWKARMAREGVSDPPVIFAGYWARKAIEDLEAEAERLREALKIIADAQRWLSLGKSPGRVAREALDA